MVRVRAVSNLPRSFPRPVLFSLDLLFPLPLFMARSTAKETLLPLPLPLALVLPTTPFLSLLMTVVLPPSLPPLRPLDLPFPLRPLLRREGEEGEDGGEEEGLEEEEEESEDVLDEELVTGRTAAIPRLRRASGSGTGCVETVGTPGGGQQEGSIREPGSAFADGEAGGEAATGEERQSTSVKTESEVERTEAK